MEVSVYKWGLPKEGRVLFKNDALCKIARPRRLKHSRQGCLVVEGKEHIVELFRDYLRMIWSDPLDCEWFGLVAQKVGAGH